MFEDWTPPTGIEAVRQNRDFMAKLEGDFKAASHLPDRAAYKIFYGQVHQAPILTLGINPGGDPATTSADGTTGLKGGAAASSAAYYEHDECDLLDCEWPENRGLRPLLSEILGDNMGRIRTHVVKTNLAFRRSAKRISASAYAESAPYLAPIIARVAPQLILLTGVALNDFTELHASAITPLAPPERDPGVHHVVFAAARVQLRATAGEALVVQVAHASQFGWTYARHGVAQRILKLLH